MNQLLSLLIILSLFFSTLSISEKKALKKLLDPNRFPFQTEKPTKKTPFFFYEPFYKEEVNESINKWIFPSSTNKSTFRIDKTEQKHRVLDDYALIYTPQNLEPQKIIRKFEKPFNPKNKGIIFQFEMTVPYITPCSNVTFKFLTEPISSNKTDNISSWVFSFGPEVCGNQARKTNMKIRFYSPKEKKWKIAKFNPGIYPRIDELPHLFTLIFDEDNNFYLILDQIIEYRGNLVEANPEWEVKLESDLRSKYENKFESEVDAILIQEFRGKSELKSKLESELKSKLKSKLESELKSKLESELKLNSELNSESKLELESKLKSELESEFESQLKSQLQSEFNLQMRPQIEKELRSRYKLELESKMESYSNFAPKIQEPKTIPNPKSTKPKNWDDREELIIEPNSQQKKLYIDSPDYFIPENWNEDIPEFIPDPTKQKPSEWVDKRDGTWKQPMIPNPECAKYSGCGKLKVPEIRNKDYMPEPVKIKNPNFNGTWNPSRIPNPKYFRNEHPVDGQIIYGFEIEIQSQNFPIYIDNILLSYFDHTRYAFEEARNTWGLKMKSKWDFLLDFYQLRYKRRYFPRDFLYTQEEILNNHPFEVEFFFIDSPSFSYTSLLNDFTDFLRSIPPKLNYFFAHHLYEYLVSLLVITLSILLFIFKKFQKEKQTAQKELQYVKIINQYFKEQKEINQKSNQKRKRIPKKIEILNEKNNENQNGNENENGNENNSK